MNAPSLYALLVPVALLLVFLVARGLRLRRALARVPVRIHVGGTRGKSAVVRLIAAGLRSGGVATLAKTTGTDPMLMRPDGRWEAWRRLGPATIAEQRRFALLTARLGAGASVLECMAIRPELVLACERSLVRATIAVVTNLRPDHLEDLPTPGALAEGALALVPANGVLVASDEALLACPALRDRAAMRGTRVIEVPTGGLDIDAANRAIAAAACVAAGVGRPVFDAAQAAPDPGAFALHELTLHGRRLRFADAFACNDVASFERLRRACLPTAEPQAPWVALLCHRADRPLRSLQFLDHFAGLPDRPQLLLAGGAFWLRRAARRRGLDVLPLRGRSGLSLDSIAAALPEGATVWGVGNYHGPSRRIARALRAGAEAVCSR